MKKILFALLMLIFAIAISISLVACDNGDDDTDENGTENGTGNENDPPIGPSDAPDGAYHVLDYELSSDGEYYVVSGWGVHFQRGEITIPSEYNGKPVKEIKDHCFSNKTDPQTYLTKIIIPDTVTRIGTQAFNGCKALTEISFGSGLVEIADGAFQNCTALTSVTFNSGLKTIGAYAFAACSSLNSITLPTALTSIGAFAFDGTRYITNEENVSNGIVFANTGKDASGAHSTWAIAVYDYGMSVATVRGKNNVSNTVGIADRIFDGCIYLSTVNLYAPLKYVGNNAFYGCTDISKVNCDVNVWSLLEIGDGNESLTSAYNK